MITEKDLAEYGFTQLEQGTWKRTFDEGEVIATLSYKGIIPYIHPINFQAPIDCKYVAASQNGCPCHLFVDMEEFKQFLDNPFREFNKRKELEEDKVYLICSHKCWY